MAGVWGASNYPEREARSVLLLIVGACLKKFTAATLIDIILLHRCMENKLFYCILFFPYK